MLIQTNSNVFSGHLGRLSRASRVVDLRLGLMVLICIASIEGRCWLLLGLMPMIRYFHLRSPSWKARTMVVGVGSW